VEQTVLDAPLIILEGFYNNEEHDMVWLTYYDFVTKGKWEYHSARQSASIVTNSRTVGNMMRVARVLEKTA